MASLVALMATSQDAVDRIDANLKRANAMLAKVPAGLFEPIEDARVLMVDKVSEYGPLIEAYAQNDELIPAVLGWDAPKRYLVLAQNPAELRPTGGFIGTYGIITFDKGRITERRFEDVFKLDVDREYEYVLPPEALDGHLLGGQSWQLADANWSPDFPISAATARALYTHESGDDRIDGVIGLTTHAIDTLLVATGPVRVPLYGVTVRAGETTLVALQQTRQEPVPGVNRKAFLDDFAARAARSRCSRCRRSPGPRSSTSCRSWGARSRPWSGSWTRTCRAAFRTSAGMAAWATSRATSCTSWMPMSLPCRS